MTNQWRTGNFGDADPPDYTEQQLHDPDGDDRSFDDPSEPDDWFDASWNDALGG